MNEPMIKILVAAGLVMSANGAYAASASSTVDTCGYPNGKAPALSSVAFSESTSLYDFSDGTQSGNTIKAWYTDEHALTLGVRQVVTKTSAGATSQDYALTAFDPVKLSATNLAVGTTALAGDQAGTDLATNSAAYGFLDHGRPIWPALFITDITADPTRVVGDWQQNGINPVAPSAIYGTWKAAVRTVDKTKTPWVVTITPDRDPAKNNWNGIPDVPPSGLGKTQGYTAELIWNVSDLPVQNQHTYRIQVMLHDGDQNKAGGDSGEACFIITFAKPM